jgi:hypothetical protein
VARGAQRLQHVQAIAAGQRQVEQHGVVAAVFEQLFDAGAVAPPFDLDVLAHERLAHAIADQGVVFNQQHLHGRPGSFKKKPGSAPFPPRWRGWGREPGGLAWRSNRTVMPLS